MKQAFIAAEDQNFYDHPGIDVFGIGRALVSNLERLRSNRRPEGASTITQQVAKNFLLSNELSYERKLKEIVLALRMERTFTKERILELYLNEIFLGNRSYGVAAAALNYFDKSLDELTIAEAALLAGPAQGAVQLRPGRAIPKPPGSAATTCSSRMQEDGYITRGRGRGRRAPSRSRCSRRSATADRRGRLLHRGGPPPAGGAARRAGLLRGRAVGARHRSPRPCRRRPTARCATVSPATTAARAGAARGAAGRRAGRRRLAGSSWHALDPGFELGDWRRGVVLRRQGRSGRGRSRRRRARPAQRRRRRPGPSGSRSRPATLVVMEEMGEADARRWVLRQRPERRGCGRGARPAHRPGAGDERRVQLPPEQVQPRHPGPAPARLGVQAVRLPGGAGVGHDAGQHRAGRADLARPGRRACPRGSPRTSATTSSVRSRCGSGWSGRAT